MGTPILFSSASSLPAGPAASPSGESGWHPSRWKRLLPAPLAAAALLACSPPRSGAPLPTPAAAPVTVIFRFDDCSARSDTALEARILQAFRSRGMSLTFGVIPFLTAGSAVDPRPLGGVPLPPGKIRMLREAARDGTVEVAQHGFAHQTTGPLFGGSLLERMSGWHSEFFEVESGLQRQKIARGKAILEEALGVRVETFIPPWNSYDQTTLSLLPELGFRNLSADREGVITPASSLRFLPSTCSVLDLPGAVESARRLPDPAPVLVALLHPGDFRESGSPGSRLDLPLLGKVLDRLSGQEGVRVLTLSRAAGEIRDAGAGRFWWNRATLLRKILPPLPGGLFLSGSRRVYLSASLARSLAIRLFLTALLLCLATGGTAAWIIRRLQRSSSSSSAATGGGRGSPPPIQARPERR